MASNKQQQQEMVERSESSSPFWRNRSPFASREPSSGGEHTKVIGAAYSHADMLKLDSLNFSGSSRPRTPPSIPLGRTSDSRTPPSKPRSNNATIGRKNYQRFFSDTNKAWGSKEDPGEGSDGDEVEFDEDEDEFGLPSIGNVRRKSKRTKNGGITNSRSTGSSNRSELRPEASLPKTNVMEAVQRSVPSYPSTKPSEGKTLRPQYREILRDPANSLHLINHPPLPPNASSKEIEAHSARISRINKFKRILQASSISLTDLRNSAWSGLPEEVRAMSWQVLLGYLPTSSERRVAALERKRREYLDGVRQAFEKGTTTGDKPTSVASSGAVSGSRAGGRGLDEAIWHQISIDVPRTNPHLELYSFETTQRSLERILYVWSIRHPASGYVQGINDLVTPFWQVFLGIYMSDPDVEFGMDPGQLPRDVLDAVEADSFWCLSKLLDGIQDNYIHAQPGIQRQVASLRDLVKRIDASLVNHLEGEGVEFIQFSFRWMNCLLMRELSVQNTVRMWDTYLAEEQGFSEFHLYVCAAFLVKWSDQLVKMDFQEIMMFLQALPTREWTVKDIELLLSEAFIWQSLFRGSSAHLRDSSARPTTAAG